MVKYHAACLCARLTEAIQCIAFNPVIHCLMSCGWTDIGEAATLLCVDCLFSVFITCFVFCLHVSSK